MGYTETAYDLFKAIYLLENEHYNFVDLDAAKTYLIAGNYKLNSIIAGETTLIYERDDIRGFIDVNEMENGKMTKKMWLRNDARSNTKNVLYKKTKKRIPQKKTLYFF